MKNTRRAQSMMEYSVLVFCIICAVVGMQYYVKRSIQGRVKSSAEQISDPYDADKVSASYTTTLNAGISTSSKIVTTGLTDNWGNPVYGVESTGSQGISIDKTNSETFTR